MTILQEANELVEAYKKEHPLTINELLKINLVEYYTNLQERFYKEVAAKRKKQNTKKLTALLVSNVLNDLQIIQEIEKRTDLNFDYDSTIFHEIEEEIASQLLKAIK